MSDEHHYEGGHELEGLNAGSLFKIIFGLGLVTLLAATAVVQWFYLQREELILARAEEGSPFLAEHRERTSKDLQGIERMAHNVTEDPSLLAPAPRPADFIDPDGPVRAPAIVPVEPPADEMPGQGAAPAEGAPAEGAPAEGAPADPPPIPAEEKDDE